MARIRSVKPDAFRSSSMRHLSIQARYVCIGLITEADDEGRFIASARALSGALFPHDDDVTAARFEGWLQEIVSVGTIDLYECDGVRYGYFPKWADHQRISHPTPSRLPNPAGEAPEALGNSSALIGKEQGTGKGTGKRNLSEAFERFWSAYPRHDGGRPKARDKFEAKVGAGADPKAIIAGAERYRDDPNRVDEYTTHATTWLNQERWDDPPLPARGKRIHPLDQQYRETL